MINCIVGRPGTGKTYMLVRLLRKNLKKGRVCYWQDFLTIDLERLCSLTFTEKVLDRLKRLVFRKYKGIQWGQLVYYSKMSDWLSLQNGVIFMDEIQMYFNSRNWTKLPDELQWKLQQHRHDSLDIWGTTQNIKRVDTVVREIINSLYLVKKIGRLFIWKEYDLVDIDKVEKESYSQGIFFLDKKIYKSYNSYQNVKAF